MHDCAYRSKQSEIVDTAVSYIAIVIMLWLLLLPNKELANLYSWVLYGSVKAGKGVGSTKGVQMDELYEKGIDCMTSFGM